MATIPRFTTQVGTDYVTLNSAGSEPMQFPRSVWDKVVADYNSSVNSNATQIQNLEAILNNPNHDYWTGKSSLANDSIDGKRQALESTIASMRSNASYNPLVDPNNVPADLNTTLSANMISPSYASDPNLEGNVYASRDAEVKRLRAEEKNSGINKVMRTVVPLGIGVGASLLGGAALGGLAGGAGLGSGVAAGEAASGLNFAAGAAAKGALSGAASGYLSSGKLGGALKGAALGGLTGGYGSSLGSSLGITSQAGQSAFTGALTGASGGIVNKDPKDALIGAALGGGLGYVQGGGLGTSAGTPLATTSGNAALQGPTAGTGITGAVTRTIPDLGSFFPSGQESGGIQNMKSLLSPIASIYSDYNSNKAISDATKKALMGGDRAALGLEPYNQIGLNAQKALSGNLSQGFSPSDLASDAGYQFRLGESQKALDRSLSSTGMTQSGAAIKAAQDRAQSLAATEYGDAYNRWLAQNQQLASLGGQGLQSAGALGDIYMGQGNVQGAASLAKADTRNKTIAEILAGLYS